MKDQYTIDDGESKQEKWNRGLDIFIGVCNQTRSCTSSMCSQSKVLS